MFKLNQNFSKLCRHYCRKLLEQRLAFLILILYLAFLFPNFSAIFKGLKEVAGWQNFLGIFWGISLVQLFFLYSFIGSCVSQLTGFPVQGLSFSFKFPKQNNLDDIRILLYTPKVDRKTVILAKFAAVATYFFAINFLLLTLPLFFYLLTFLPFLTALFFLLLNGLVFAVVNFIFLVPLLFYFYENFSLLKVLIFGAVFGLFGFAIYWWWEKIIQYPLILPLLFSALFVLSGYFCFSFYQKKYLKKDLV